jgi:hypothetical protein
VTVVAPPVFTGLISTAVYGIVALAVLGALGYYVFVMRKKQ